jgi:NAD(P)-dependent dehydrogenase (short-subunit alcohol dehydrogenase family)
MTEFAVVTGGSRGIGAAVAERLREDGYGIIVVDRLPPEHGWADVFVEADLEDVGEAARRLGAACDGKEVTCLVNNAGIVAPATLEDTTMADVNRVFAINLRAAIACAQQVLPSMKAAGHGRIVNISSRAALGKELRTAYSASKAGLIGLTKSWALELAEHKITVNAIGPGPIRTALFEDANPADAPRTQAIIDNVPLGILGEPSDVAEAVAFFASSRARFITGQILYVCGGMTIGAVS